MANQTAHACSDSVGVRWTKGHWGGRREGARRKLVLRDPVRFRVDLEGPQSVALEEIAGEHGVSIASLVREAIVGHLRRRKRK